MIPRPSGTVTFLFTDVEGSTRRWEVDPDRMQIQMEAHDEVLQSAIEACGGWQFRHTGDGVCAAFSSANNAVRAAIDAQRSLRLPVRMGIVTGDAQQRGDDYVGPTLNRAARVMAVAYSGQILVSSLAAESVCDFELIDLGEHRLRDLSGADRLFQVRGEGLAKTFPRLQTIDAVPGNLGIQPTSFVGRDIEVKEVTELVRQHRLLTLTGVGGVGKTRLALQAAADVAPEFHDGVWMVELGHVSDIDAVPDAVATALGVTVRAGMSVVASVADALRDRQVLLVLDNCEHILEAAANLIEEVLSTATTASILATSREGMRIAGEHLWPVPPLDVHEGAASGAVQLFLERAESVDPEFTLEDKGNLEAVIEICNRVDGLALAIELAAARMVSMTPAELAARLHERFRLLSGSQRGSQRHQTLRQAVQWSYDQLNTAEQAVLGACAVFAGSFDIASATAVCAQFDEFEVLDGLDSLVRKSLVSANKVGGRTRYSLLETIRHFAEDQHTEQASASSATDADTQSSLGTFDAIRDLHAQHYAAEAARRFGFWDGPRMHEAADWVEVEFDDLRAGFYWAYNSGDIESAVSIAAHTPMIAFGLQRLEPVSWAEEVLPAAEAAQAMHLPRLYTCASLCSYKGRHDDALRYAQTAQTLRSNPRYQAFDKAWAGFREAVAHLDAGRPDRYLEICRGLADQPGLAQVIGLCGLVAFLPSVGETEEAMALAGDAMAAATAYASPYWIAFAHVGHGRAFAEADPARALTGLREGLDYAREHPIPYWVAVFAREAGGLEAFHGDTSRALELLNTSLEAFRQAGNSSTPAWTLASLVVLFDRLGHHEIAATIYGATTRYPIADLILGFAAALENLRNSLDPATFDSAVSAGAAMGLTEAVHYAHDQIQNVRATPRGASEQ